jgi:signal transduction histidine kinase
MLEAMSGPQQGRPPESADDGMSILPHETPGNPPRAPRWRYKVFGIIVRYGVAVASIGVTLLIKLALKNHLEMGVEREAPFMLSLAAVMVSGWYGGLGPGLFATLLATAIGDYFFMEPLYHFGSYNGAQKIRLIIFIIEATVVSVLSETLRTARRRAEENEAEARGLQRELLEITDTEQRRIGHDLHDGLGQHLTGIAFMSKLMEQRLTAREVPEAEQARKIAGLVNKAIGWTRDLARGLAPVDLDQEEGLASALRQLTEAAGDMYGATCRFERVGDVNVGNPTIAIHLYRIAQEALNNAIKHGRPRNVTVRLTGTGGREISVRVEDDGAGFDPALVRGGGMGLRIMRYRAKMIAGNLEVRTRPGGGTVVSCSCMLPEPPSPPPPPPHKDSPHDRRDQQQTVGSTNH